MSAANQQAYRCPVCEAPTQLKFEHSVLRARQAYYLTCDRCSFTFARPADWLAEAYSSAMGVTDTGVAVRNESMARLLAAFAWLGGHGSARGLDVGGGHGLLVRMLRDRGLDFRWFDQHAQNLFAVGFEDDGGHYDWLTLVEVFEHLVEPYIFMKDLVDRYQPRRMFLTTELKPTDLPSTDWWYWSFESGQHVGFASLTTLEVLAGRLGYGLFSCGSVHLLTRDPADARPFRWAASRLRRCLAALARRKLGSLTSSDHQRLKASLSNTPRTPA